MLRPQMCCIVIGVALLVAGCGGGGGAPGEGLAGQGGDATLGPEDPGPEQAVIVHVVAGEDSLFLDLIEEPLIEAIEVSDVGEFDGNLIGAEEAVLYMYGPDANALFAAIAGVLQDADLPAGSYAIKRFGGPGASEERVNLNE